MGRLTDLAAAAAKRQGKRVARRAYSRSPLGQVQREVQRLGSSASKQKAFQAAVERLSGQGVMRQIDEAGGVQKYAMGMATRAALTHVFRVLGPLGQVLQPLLEAQQRGQDLQRQIDVAARFLRAFGYDVSRQAGTMRGAARIIEKSGSAKDRRIARDLQALARSETRREKVEAREARDEARAAAREARRQARIDRARDKIRTGTPGSASVNKAIALLEREGELPEAWPEESNLGTLPRGTQQPGEPAFEAEILTPDSSNVFSVAFTKEGKYSGIMFVTFKAWSPGMKSKDRPNSRGPMYGYYGVPVARWHAFKRKLGGGGKGAGGAVWDYLRVRGEGNAHVHQFPYRLVQATVSHGPDMIPGIPPGGVYIPRKQTARGWRKRSLPMQTAGGRMRSSETMTSTLPEHIWRATPNSGQAPSSNV